MKKIKTYNNFINESLKDKLKGKSDDEIFSTLDKMNPNDILLQSSINGYKYGINKSLELGADIGFDGYAALLNSIIFNQPSLFYYLYDLSINNIIEKSKRGKLMNPLNTEIKELNYDIIDIIINNSFYENYLNILKFLLDNENTDTYDVLKKQTEKCILREQNKIMKIFCVYIDESIMEYLDYYINFAREMRKHYIRSILEKRKEELLKNKMNESLRDKLKGKSNNELIESFIKVINDKKHYYMIDHINDTKNIIKSIDDEDELQVFNDFLKSFNIMPKMINSKPEELIVISEDDNYYDYIDRYFDILKFYDTDKEIYSDTEYHNDIYKENKIIKGKSLNYYDNPNVLIFNKDFILNKIKKLYNQNNDN